MPLPRAFLLAAACCRWPLSQEAIADIAALAGEPTDWPHFLRIVQRQRIAGLAYHALVTAKVGIPTSVAQQLAASAQQITRHNLSASAETYRLQRVFDAACIPVVVLKGVSLAQAAYGSLTLKHAKDIDLFVPVARAEEALQLLERDGSTLFRPADRLSENQRRNALHYGLEVSLRTPRNLEVELRWQLTDNALLLAAGDAFSTTQDIALSESITLRTLGDELLFAYLCAHGAGHGWSRLKWLADVNALIARKSASEIEALYQSAAARGASICAGQALLLCHRLLRLPLAGKLQDRLQRSTRLKLLVAMALNLMTNDNEIEDSPFGSTRVALMQLLLANSMAYFFEQCRVMSIHRGDAVHYPLPAGLHFLYPILRLPLWLWRRLHWTAATGRHRTGEAALRPRKARRQPRLESRR